MRKLNYFYNNQIILLRISRIISKISSVFTGPLLRMSRIISKISSVYYGSYFYLPIL
jgi:hypothetical protein